MQGQLIVDEEFRDLIPPLSPQDRQQLEENLIGDGCRDALVRWKETEILLDGHNRKEICDRLSIPYDVIDKSFPSREEAKAWVIRNQLGKRNLELYQRIELALALELLIRARAQERQAATSARAPRDDRGRVQPVAQNSSKPVSTRETIAAMAGVSENTVARAKVIAEKAPEEVKEQLRRGEMSINRAYGQLPERQVKPSRKPMAEFFGESQRHVGKLLTIINKLKDMTRNQAANKRCSDIAYALSRELRAWQKETDKTPAADAA